MSGSGKPFEVWTTEPVGAATRVHFRRLKLIGKDTTISGGLVIAAAAAKRRPNTRLVVFNAPLQRNVAIIDAKGV